MATPSHPDQLTLEQAWSFLMQQFAYRNPSKVAQSNLALRSINQAISGRRRLV